MHPEKEKESEEAGKRKREEGERRKEKEKEKEKEKHKQKKEERQKKEEMEKEKEKEKKEEKEGIFLLGSYYGPIIGGDNRWGEYPSFLRHFQSRLWVTYRSGFEEIRPTFLTSDAGWGCMLRSGQMLLGEALIRHILGKEWRLGYNRKEVVRKYAEIVSWFFDTMSTHSPYSIHRIAILGKQFGKEIGEWFGPATISSVLQALVKDRGPKEMGVYVANDGVIYKDKLAEACCGKSDASLLSDENAEEKQGEWKSVLILIPLRLGLESVNKIYEDGIKDCFRFPQCVGIAGGRPNASLYFVGVEGDQLLYLDPHFTRPMVEIKPLEQYTEEDLSSYHCHDVRKIDLSRIDPSLLLGFYCSSKSDLISFLDCAQKKSKRMTPIFSVDEELPVYNDTVDIQDIEDDPSSDFDMI